ncbi:MAG: Eco57I restriction-modification methylase domain-containing protein [Nitriliruptoraceae bacterium]
MEPSSHEPMGEVFTRRWVVEWMLDLAGYTPDRPLHDLALLEPSCGAGAFLLPALDRLLAACARHDTDVGDATDAITAVDLHGPSVDVTRKAVITRLEDAGVATSDAENLAERWVRSADFLLDDIPAADFVVGNPPYVRVEDVPRHLATDYRARWKTMGGRADLYVGFYERGLQLLKDDGVLAFICADRWMRNAYGKGLRTMITGGPWAVDTIVRLHDVDCFEEEVSAYPAITVLRRGTQGDGTVIDANGAFGADDVPGAMAALRNRGVKGPFTIARVDGWFGADVWPEGTATQLAQIADHEHRLDPLEDVLRQTRVGIGVATGADDIFITEDQELAEPDRMLPLVMARHIATGKLAWTPTYLANPWNNQGLIQLGDHPRLADHFQRHHIRLVGRHTARRTPDRWYKTIDRVHSWLAGTPKVLLADMKARMTPVLEPGGLYPHHNLYWITSTRWDLHVLAGLLCSDQAELFVRAYCVKMRGGTLRMQAQYLRKIRLPDPASITQGEADALRQAYTHRDRQLATSIAETLYAR